MAGQILITPDAMREAAAQYRQIMDETAATVTELEQIRALVDSAWDGAASGEVMRSFEELRTGAKSVSQGVGECADKLNQVVDAFEALDGDGPIFKIMPVPERFTQVLGCIPKFLIALPGTVRIVPEQVREAADQCKALSNIHLECGERFAAVTQSLQGRWEGNAYQKFLDESADIAKSLRKIGEAVEEMCVRLRRAANKYEELDNSL